VYYISIYLRDLFLSLLHHHCSMGMAAMPHTLYVARPRAAGSHVWRGRPEAIPEAEPAEGVAGRDHARVPDTVHR